MAGNRRYIPASVFCESVRDGTHDSPKPVEQGRKLVTSRHIVGGRLDLSEAYLISDEDFDAIQKRSRVNRWDVLISMIGTVGEACLIKDEPDFAIKNVGIFKTRNETDGKWLYYFLRSPYAQQAIREQSRGTTQQYMPLGALRDFPILITDDPEEKSIIVKTLGSLDDKIELNRRMNETLEAMARALFQSWFVDFDPVRAKLDGRQPAGMDAETAAQFPAAFQDSPLGPIPKGWEVRCLDRIADYLNGLALQKFPPGDGPTLPVIKIAQLRKGDTADADLCSADLPAEYIIQNGDVLFSWSGSLEVELWCGGRGALNQHLFKVTSPEFPKWFYYLWTRYHLNEFRLIAAGKATTMGHIQRGHITDAKVLVPPQTLLGAMSRIVSPLIDRIVANRIQSRVLATLRDALLPKLLSGELSVRESERS